MPIKRLSQISLLSFQKHSNMLAGNPAYQPPAFELLETVLISANTTSITFSSLGSYSDYKHLQIRNTLKSTSSTDNLRITFNSDSGLNYGIHSLEANGTTVATDASVGIGNLFITNSASQNNLTGVFGATVIDILDFSNTSKNKTIKAFGGRGETTPSAQVTLTSGYWNNTSAITSITLTIGGGAQIVTGSRFSLYGIK